MSELQVSLLVLGVAAIGGVLAYNAWDARRHRQLAERLLPKRDADPLLVPGTSPVAEAVVAAPRVEPVLDREAESAAAPEAIAAEPAEAAVNPPAAPPDPALLTPLADFAIRLDAVDAVSGDRLLRLEAELARSVAHRVAVIALDAQRGRWEVPQASASYGTLMAGLQLADRKGPADAREIDVFTRAVGSFADEIMAVVDAPATQSVGGRARDLDALCAKFDNQVGINVVGRNTAFSPARLKGLLEKHGAQAGEGGSALIVDEQGEHRFAIVDLDGQPLAPEAIAGAEIRGLTFLLDVPNVADGNAAFSRMVQVARDFAGTLGGELVDDQRALLTEAAIEAIRRQIAQQQGWQRDSGIAPGSALARRLFR
jgi:hypothetical protein